MPCRDLSENDDLRIEPAHFKELQMCKASLCAVLSQLECDANLPDFFKRIDWKEAGIKRTELEKWWREHKAADLERRGREARAKEEKRQRAAALRKLTFKERRLLNIKIEDDEDEE
jgi:hypothetical protein